jgi:hypothetical protein
MFGELTWKIGLRVKWDVAQITPPPIIPETILPQVLMCSSGIQAETVMAPSP